MQHFSRLEVQHGFGLLPFYPFFGLVAVVLVPMTCAWPLNRWEPYPQFIMFL